MKYQAPQWATKQKGWSKGLLFLAFFIALAIAGSLLLGVVHINIIPYQRLVHGINGAIQASDNGLKGNEGLIVLLSKIPGVATVGGWIAYGVGAIIYVLMQACKLLPKWIYRIPNVLKGVVAEQGKNYPVKDGDSRTVRKAKKALNIGYAWALSYTGTIRLVAYIVDFFVCLAVYSPVKGTRGNAFNALGATIQAVWYQEWYRIDWFSFALFALATYGVEATLKLIWAINDLRKAALKGATA